MDLSRLNPQQQQAVLAGTHPLLVLAGAGTGKTTVITYRIAHLLSLGAYPDELLAVTFTNKAAREMRGRAEALCQLPERTLTIGTFHNICGRVLRQYGHLLGLDRNFLIYDSADQLTQVKRVMAELEIDAQTVRPRSVRHHIEQWKNQGLLPHEVTPKDPLSFMAQKVYRTYEKRLLEANAVDFGGMLVNTYVLLKKYEEARRDLRTRWRYLLVDEYQDTNRVQYEILRQLTTPEHSLTVVGDDDQSIYRWRGADIGNILRFEQDFPSAQVVRLERNYRSTQTILSAANAVIANNASRKGKTLFTDAGSGPPISVRMFDDERQEGEAVGMAISDALREGMNPAEIAVLYRTNAQSRPIEDALRRRNIHYAVYGGLKFYDRREIKDALSYLRLIANPRSDLDFARVVNTPARGIGKTTLDRLGRLASSRGVSLLEAARLAGEGEASDIRGRPRAALQAFAALMQQLIDASRTLDPAKVLELTLQETGYRRDLQEDGTPESADRVENLTELHEALSEFVAFNPGAGLATFLEEVSLVADVDEMPEGGATLSLMTLHSAKGLEFEMVFMPGMEEGVFPHHRSLTNHAELEEERRLCYVGITRAKRVLHMSVVRERYGFGRTEFLQPSRFLKEIPVELLHLGPLTAGWDEEPEEWDNDVPADAYLQDETAEELDDSFDPDELEESTLDASFEPDELEAQPPPPLPVREEGGGFAPGTRVYHRTFGEGAVVRVTGSGRYQRLVVKFPEVGEKSIVPKWLEVLR